MYITNNISLTSLQHKPALNKASHNYSSKFSIPSTSTISASDTKIQLSKTYNMRCATHEELCEFANELYEAGLISSQLRGIITLDLSRGDTDDNQTPADAAGRRNWIAEFGARAKVALAFGDISGYATDSNIVALLKRFST